jgi:hypothetical protein
MLTLKFLYCSQDPRASFQKTKNSKKQPKLHKKLNPLLYLPSSFFMTSFVNKPLQNISLYRKFKTDSDNFSSLFPFLTVTKRKKERRRVRFEYSFSISPTDVRKVKERNRDRISNMIIKKCMKRKRLGSS